MSPSSLTVRAVLLLGVLALLGRSQVPENCSGGKVYNSCGTACPLTCNNYQDPPTCTEECVEGCFCPQGQVQHNARCVDPEDCSALVDDDPCEDDSSCRDDQVCEVFVSGCGAEDNYCYRDPLCKDPPYVPCGSDAFLACDSEWTYCLQQNKTRRAHCVGSCLSDNGNCGDQVCITTVSDTDSPRIQCVESDDLPTDCPAGQILDDSGCVSPCQDTCEDVVRGIPSSCATVCIVTPTCVCPMGLVRFRDRCVDPRLCYVLLTYPPAIRPLPIVDPNSVLLSLYSRSTSSHQFGEREQNRLAGNVRTVLANRGYSEVVVTVHGVYEDDNQLQIVVVIRGDSVSQYSIASLLRILDQSSDDLGISVERFSQVDVDYVEEDAVLSTGAIVGIAVSSIVAGLAIVVAWILIVLFCCVMKGSSKKTAPSKLPQGEKSNTYTNIIFHEKDSENLDEEDLKSDVALKSLCD